MQWGCGRGQEGYGGKEREELGETRLSECKQYGKERGRYSRQQRDAVRDCKKRGKEKKEKEGEERAERGERKYDVRCKERGEDVGTER